MEIELLWVFLFLALSIGWLLGFYTKPSNKIDEESYQAPQEIKHRLQLLFDSYSDESIDRFVHSLEVTPETLGTHISIGKHFRSQGEVEKAILIHQNLMAHPELPDLASESIIYELAKDYKKAGLLDRAESLLRQLTTSKLFGFKSLILLLDVYEHEKDWENAVSKGLELELKKHPDVALRVAQYYCEIAEDKQYKGQFLEIRRCFKQALNIHKECIRALIGLARLDIEHKEFAFALNSLKQVAVLSPENITLTLPMLLECTVATNSFERQQAYLEKMYKDTGQVPIMLAIVESLLTQGETTRAYQYLEGQIHLNPSLSALDMMFKKCGCDDLNSEQVDQALNPSEKNLCENMLGVVSKVIDDVVADKPSYRCNQCGFSGGQHHWMCPSCKGWQTTQPLVEYDNTL